MSNLIVPGTVAPPENKLIKCPYCHYLKSTQLNVEADEPSQYRRIEDEMVREMETLRKEPVEKPIDFKTGTRRCPKCHKHFRIIYSVSLGLMRAYRKGDLTPSALLYT